MPPTPASNPPAPTPADSTDSPASFQRRYAAVVAELQKVVVGQRLVIRNALICLLIGGHALVEGVPGLGKTLLVRTLGQALDLQFSRIQFTPDLMPADIIGATILVQDAAGARSLEFQPGPLFSNIILADEINRATPKTQSALLEAMGERSVTVGRHTHRLEEPFFVLATQNPLEMEGTYPLPEAQLDRFAMNIMVESPELPDLLAILDRTTGQIAGAVRAVLAAADVLEMQALVRDVPAASHVKQYAARLVLATRPESAGAPDVIKKFVRYGASPRGAQTLLLAAKACALINGRPNAAFSDIKDFAVPVLRHRLALNFEGQAEGITRDALVQAVLSAVPEAGD